MRKTYYLFFLEPENNAPEIQIFPGQMYTIGRSPSSNILLSDSNVSRNHAKLEFINGNFYLTDLESTNGTFVNDKKVKKAVLNSLDKLTFGKAVFTFWVKQEFEKGVEASASSSSGRDTFNAHTINGELEELISEVSDPLLQQKLNMIKQKLSNSRKNLMVMAFRDELTGLFNRRYFDKILAQELKRANRYRRDMSLIMVDIDHFKKFNDQYGHQKGDSVLRTVGTIIRENVRSTDVACRYGGEEIAVVLPEQDLKQACMIAEKLRIKLESLAKEIEGVSVTASFGVGSAGIKQLSAEELIKRTDTALYSAKKAGRNCTRCMKEG